MSHTSRLCGCSILPQTRSQIFVCACGRAFLWYERSWKWRKLRWTCALLFDGAWHFKIRAVIDFHKEFSYVMPSYEWKSFLLSCLPSSRSASKFPYLNSVRIYSLNIRITQLYRRNFLNFSAIHLSRSSLCIIITRTFIHNIM